MDDATCPSCKESVGQVRERTVVEDGVKVSFECDDCDHEWKVVF